MLKKLSLILTIFLLSCASQKSTVPYSDFDRSPAYEVDYTPVPSKRHGIVEIVTEHETWAEKDTIEAINWQMHASGKWWIMRTDSVEFWSDKAPVVLKRK